MACFSCNASIDLASGERFKLPETFGSGELSWELGEQEEPIVLKWISGSDLSLLDDAHLGDLWILKIYDTELNLISVYYGTSLLVDF